uniref:CxC ATPase DNA modification system associated small protein n=1 Tax=Scandinavium goeteborgense TaxID=1851514 RepID=UPI0013586E14|nr:CxC ATPase DNA modification system associated small protein [Scandinavium goeteborgense]
MDLSAFKVLLKEIDKDTQLAHEDYSNKSAIHKAALQVMQFEKELYYGDLVQGRHLQKIKDIIEINAEDIVNEINKS